MWKELISEKNVRLNERLKNKERILFDKEKSEAALHLLIQAKEKNSI